MSNIYINMRHILLCLCLLAGINAFAYDAKIDGICYNFSGSEAHVTSGLEYSGNVVIPSSVIYGGKTYSVIGIGEYAFDSCSGLTSIIIPESVTSIEPRAFYNCTGLKEIYCHAKETPEVYSSSFSGVDVAAVTLIVPEDAVEQYKVHDVWGLFLIESEDGIYSVPAEEDNKITDIYDLNGQRIPAPQNRKSTYVKGINIIRYSDVTTRKVLVK